MRDRRNTNLSVSSNSSSGSASPTPSRGSLNEKPCANLSSPPSPTLPAPVTKENRPRLRSKRSLAVKALATLLLLGLICFRLSFHDIVLTKWFPQTKETASVINIAEDAVRPSDPAALIVSDARGVSRWTVSIPDKLTFPLPPNDYKDICRHGDFLRDALTSDSPSSRTRFFHRRHGLFGSDETFLDVSNAERAALLPKPASDDDVDEICESSLTFVLGADDASFGKSLLLMWLSYGLAQREGRAFFLDDSTWAWGGYAAYFVPPTPPQCRPPPSRWIVPCPHNAEHLLVSTATAPWIFGSGFHEEFLHGRKHGAARQSRIFDLARTGWEALWKLTDDDVTYAASRVSQLRTEASSHRGLLVGMHIRRGDLHPVEFQYSRDYLPLERFSVTAQSLLHSLVASGKSHPRAGEPPALYPPPLVVASDDPDIVEADELTQTVSPMTVQRAQEKIRLATKAALDQARPVAPLRAPGSAYVKHVEENAGWEGGFYTALFFSMGGGSTSSASDEALRLRELVGRAYLLDLAVLGQSDGVVCAVSSATCRALAVMMGWEAVEEGRWVNVDDRRMWSWDGRGK